MTQPPSYTSEEVQAAPEQVYRFLNQSPLRAHSNLVEILLSCGNIALESYPQEVGKILSPSVFGAAWCRVGLTMTPQE